jgi:hypothetical protein
MPRSFTEHFDPTVRPKRILALDGGGFRGVWCESLEQPCAAGVDDGDDGRLSIARTSGARSTACVAPTGPQARAQAG